MFATVVSHAFPLGSLFLLLKCILNIWAYGHQLIADSLGIYESKNTFIWLQFFWNGSLSGYKSVA